MSATLYPPPSPFTTLSKRASAILQGNPSLNSLNLLELDELLGWAESAKSSSHHSTALDELDKLLGEFNIDSVDRPDKGELSEAKRQLTRNETFHTSEGDIRANEIVMPSRVFSEPRMEIMSPPPSLSPPPLASLQQPPTRKSTTPTPVALPQPPARELNQDLLHNFFGRRHLTDEFSDMSSVHRAATPSVCSTVYSNSFSSSERASNYTMFSPLNRREAYQGVPFTNPKMTLIHRGTLHKDCNSLRGNGTMQSRYGGTLNGTLNSTYTSGMGTLRSNGSNPLLKGTRKKKKCRFVLCTPV